MVNPRNKEYSKKVSKKNNKPTIVVSEKTTTDVGKVIDDFKDNNKDLDVDKSLTKLKKHNPNPTAQDITNWLSNDLAKGWNIKQPEWTYYDTGLVRVYCSKCGERGMANDIKEAKYENSCCGVDWLPEPHATIEQG